MIKSKYIEWVINEKNHKHADMSSSNSINTNGRYPHKMTLQY